MDHKSTKIFSGPILSGRPEGVKVEDVYSQRSPYFRLLVMDRVGSRPVGSADIPAVQGTYSVIHFEWDYESLGWRRVP